MPTKALNFKKKCGGNSATTYKYSIYKSSPKMIPHNSDDQNLNPLTKQLRMCGLEKGTETTVKGIQEKGDTFSF